jgi:signal transduction histidine kinase/ActR/RegA family two-component response regulator
VSPALALPCCTHRPYLQLVNRTPRTPTRRRVRNRLLLPAAIVAACLAALAGVRAWELRDAQIDAQKLKALQLVSSSARTVDATIAETQTLLVSLAELLDPRATPERNDALLQRIFRAAPVPYANLWIADTAGHSIGAARMPEGGRAAFAIRDRPYFTRAMTSRTFAAGDVVESRVLPGHPLVAIFTLPVIDSATGAVTAVVGASIQIDSLEPVRTVRALPEGSVLTILDSTGTVVFRSLDVAHWVGRNFPVYSGELNDYSAQSGVGAGLSSDGTYRLTGFHTTERAPWILYVGIPLRYTLDVVRDQFFRDLVLGTLVALIVLALGYASTLRVVTPIESLTADARAIAGGDTARRSSVDSSDEIGDLARAFNQMADTVVRRNAELKSSQEQLLHVQKMDALGSFAGGIAHDFNNYLASIVAHAELADLGLAEDDPARLDLREVLTSASRAADLTRQILVFSRKQMVELHTLDLNEVVRGIERMLLRLIGEELQLDVRYAPHPVLVNADHGQLEQVIVNLVANARDAMPDGGIVTIAIDSVNLTIDDGRLPTLPRGAYSQVTVSDEGTGIPPELLDRVFDPFFSTKKRGRGTGMGLAIAYSIIEQSGGQMLVASTPGLRTTFTAILPTDPGTVDVAQPSVTRRIVQPGHGRILLVEDDAAVRSSCERMLIRVGYQVVAAADGSSALHQLRAAGEPFDLLLSDVVMPGMSGSELARRVKELQPAIAVLFMSGYADDEVVHDAVAASAATCVTKPFTVQTLTDAVQMALSRRADALSA